MCLSSILVYDQHLTHLFLRENLLLVKIMKIPVRPLTHIVLAHIIYIYFHMVFHNWPKSSSIY